MPPLLPAEETEGILYITAKVLVGECSAFLASGSDPTNVRHKNNGVEQKADVVLLKKELDYMHYRLFAAYLCLYRRLHGPEYPQLRVEVAFVNNAHTRSVGVLRYVTRFRYGLRLFRVT